jgi:hypothetical protein
MRTNIKKINDWVLERYLLEELPKDKLEEISLQLKEDPGLQKALERLKHSNKEILAQNPPNTIIPGILNLYRAEKARKEHMPVPRAKPVLLRRLLYASPALAVVLVLFFFLLPFRSGDITPSKSRPLPGKEPTRIKGEQPINMTKPHLMIYRKDKDNVQLLEAGMKASAGDLLQMTYVAGGETYGVILSIDGNGVVTLHYPDRKDRSPILEQKKKILLDNAYELDDAPGFERFFLITSTSAIDVELVLEQANLLAKDTNRAKTGHIELPQGINQASILINKEGGTTPKLK